MILGIHSDNPSADRRKFVKVWRPDAASFWPLHPWLFLGQSKDLDNARLGQTMEQESPNVLFR